MYRKDVISLEQFLFKSAFSISFHKTIKAVASVPAGRLRLQSAVLTRVIAVWFTEISWLTVPFCYLPYMPYALCFVHYHILCFHYTESWDLTWVLHTTKTPLLLCSSLYKSWSLCLKLNFQSNTVILNALKLGCFQSSSVIQSLILKHC